MQLNEDQERVFENLQAAYDIELKECDACHDEEFDQKKSSQQFINFNVPVLFNIKSGFLFGVRLNVYRFCVSKV